MNTGASTGGLGGLNPPFVFLLYGWGRQSHFIDKENRPWWAPRRARFGALGPVEKYTPAPPLSAALPIRDREVITSKASSSNKRLQVTLLVWLTVSKFFLKNILLRKELRYLH